MADRVNPQSITNILRGEPERIQPTEEIRSSPSNLSSLTTILRGTTTQPTTPVQSPISTEPSVAEDTARSFGGGALSGTGLTVEGAGHANRLAEVMLSPWNLLLAPEERPSAYVSHLTENAANWLNKKSEGLLRGRSTETLQKIQDAQITGNLFQPDTWDFGDPSLQGTGLQLTEILGQLTPILVVGAATGGVGAAATGGLQGGQAGREEAERLVQESFDEGVLQEVVPRYKKLIEQGTTPEEALRIIKQDAGDAAQMLVSPISGLGGAATSKIFQGELVRGMAGNIASRIGVSAGLGAVEEGVQEVAETVAARTATNLSTGLDVEIAENTFADFVLGAMAGGAVGTVGGLRPTKDTEPVNNDEVTRFSDEDLGTDRTGVDAVDAPAKSPDTSLVTTPESEFVGQESRTAPGAEIEQTETVDTAPVTEDTVELEEQIWQQVEAENTVVSGVTLPLLETAIAVRNINPEALTRENFPEFVRAVTEIERTSKTGIAKRRKYRELTKRWTEPQESQSIIPIPSGLQPAVNPENNNVIDLTEKVETRKLEQFHTEFQSEVRRRAVERQAIVEELTLNGTYSEFEPGFRFRTKKGNSHKVTGKILIPVNDTARQETLYKEQGWGTPSFVRVGDKLYFPAVRTVDQEGNEGSLNLDALRKQGFEAFTGPKGAKAKNPGIAETTSVPEDFYEQMEAELNRKGWKVTLARMPKEYQEKFLGLGGFNIDINKFYIAISESLPTDQNPEAIFHHEMVHVMRAMGLFHSIQGERTWRLLVKEAKAVLSRHPTIDIDSHLRNEYAPENHEEETIAILFQEWKNGRYKPEPKTVTDKALRAIEDFIESIYNWIRGMGFRTAEDVIEFLAGANAQEVKAYLDVADSTLTSIELDLQKGLSAAKKIGVKNPNIGNVDYFTRLTKHGWTIIQLAKKNLHIPWLQTYVQHASQWHAEKMKWLSHANETANRWQNLPLAQQRALADTLLEVEQMSYRSANEVATGVVRKPTRNELIAIFRRHKLSKEAVKLYTQIRSDFDAMLNKIEQVTIASIQRTLINDPLSMQIETAKAQKEFRLLRRAPYFPHARFGQYTIVVKDATGKTAYAEMFETEKKRDKAFASVEQKFSGTHVVSKSKLSEEAEIYRGIPHAFLVAMKSNLKLNLNQLKALEEMIVHSMPAVSFRNHFVKKENTPGYSRDALRAYAEYFWHGANHIARIEFGPMMEEDILSGTQNIRTMINTGEDSTTRVRIHDFVKHHYENIMNPKEDWAALRSIGFMWWLGFNVKSAVLNLTQIPLVTYSHLGTHFGDVSANASLVKATTQLPKMYRSPNAAASAATNADLKLIALGIEQGFLDESFAAELAGLAEGSNLSKSMAKTRARRMLTQFNHAAGYMFQAMEKINRRVSFMAAVNLARSKPNAKYLNEVRTRFNLEHSELLKQGFTPTEATAFLAGKDTVESTQFNYSAWTRPRMMEGRKSAFLTFFMFTQNMLWFIKNSPANTRYLLMLLLFAGVQGMPGMEDMQEIVKAVGNRAFGKEWNIEKELRELLVEVMGEDGPPPDLFLHGISRYGFGLPLLGDMTGLPLPSVDMSASIGMGSPLPVISPGIQAASDAATGRDFDEVLGNFTQEGVGATLGIPFAAIKALADSRMNFADPKRWESAMPAAMNSISKALRYMRENSERTRSGAEIIEYDRNNPEHMMEIIVRGLGFTPTRTSQTWDRLIMQREGARFWQFRRELLLRQYDYAKEREDEDDLADVQAAIRRFNLEVPERKMKLTRKTLSRSRKQRELGRAKEEANKPRSKMMEGVYNEIGRLHPELNVTESEDPVPSGN